MLETMPELLCPSGQESSAVIAAVSDSPVLSQLQDEFVLGFRDCANESLRYLETTTVTASDAGVSHASEGQRLIDALRMHLLEHEARVMRRRRRLYNHDEEDRSATATEHAEDRHSSLRPPRRRRRVRLTPLSIHSRRLRRHTQDVHYPEQIQTVHSQSGDISASSSKVTYSPSDDSGCSENTDELRLFASELSTLADGDVRVGRLLTELFQLMDSNDD